MTLGCDIGDGMVVDESEHGNSFKEKVSNMFMIQGNRPVGSQMKRKKKKKPLLPLRSAAFVDLYKFTGETLGEGSNGSVKTCKNVFTGTEYAVKIIEKVPGTFSRSKVLKEIEIYHLCRGQKNIIQLIEFFDEEHHFYLVFEKISGGSLLEHIQKRVEFTEAEASMIIKDITKAIKHLHQQGIAHRDIKPDNVLCLNTNSPCPVKLCDFDLCSSVSIEVSTPQLLTPVGSLEYMAPEVVNTFIIDDYDDEEEEVYYNKSCDLWSLGILMYILLCGYPPFSGNCSLDCGWEKGESCLLCQQMLLSKIKTEDVTFPEQEWQSISIEAKDLIQCLLNKEYSLRLDVCQVLEHPWVVNGGSHHTLHTPANLKRQTSIKDLEDFASRTMAINRAVENVDDFDCNMDTMETIPFNAPGKRRTISCDLTPSNLSTSLFNCRSKNLLNKFASINEIGRVFFLRNIC